MISDFEARLATVLGAQLPAPFGGTVSVAADSDSAHGSQPRIYVGVYKIETRPRGFGDNRSIAVPALTDHIRVMAMKVLVNINVMAANNADRGQQLQGIEHVLYLLNHQSFQTGAALLDSSDQGFAIESMQLKESFIEVSNAPLEQREPGISLEAEGIFWPIGITGETGVAIAEIRLRGLVIDLQPGVALPDISAGGDPIAIELRLQGLAAHRLAGDGSPLIFTELALALQQEDGSAGAGTLSADRAGAGLVQFATITDSSLNVTYTPPASAAHDVLLVGFDDGADGFGQLVNRFELRVK